MMKVGISVWEDRISPVLDGCSRFLVVEIEDGQEVWREGAEISETYLPFRARAIVDLGIDVLICGAVSRPLAAMLSGSGISVIGWMNGNVDDVSQDFLSGKLDARMFDMRRGFGMRKGHGPGRRRLRDCHGRFGKGGIRA
ncbi:MAG: hypothetical protein DRH70_03330 [Candidatus Coatesbacteria bacterium]|nr:MAG: hypothetical protein DRH70_03330 [Candidatus Coatesbacteria bacterium]